MKNGLTHEDDRYKRFAIASFGIRLSRNLERNCFGSLSTTEGLVSCMASYWHEDLTYGNSHNIGFHMRCKAEERTCVEGSSGVETSSCSACRLVDVNWSHFMIKSSTLLLQTALASTETKTTFASEFISFTIRLSIESSPPCLFRFLCAILEESCHPRARQPSLS